MEEIAKNARIVVATICGRLYIRIIPHDKSKVEEIATKLMEVGIRVSISRKRREVRIYEQRSVEVISKVAPTFSHAVIPPTSLCHYSPQV